MAFGGEPLLYPETVYAIMKSALKMNIQKRQVITNGYFSCDASKIRGVAEKLAQSGVNDLLGTLINHAVIISLEADANF